MNSVWTILESSGAEAVVEKSDVWMVIVDEWRLNICIVVTLIARDMNGTNIQRRLSRVSQQHPSTKLSQSLTRL